MGDEKLDPQMKRALEMHEASGKVLELLKPLSQRARIRVLRFIMDKIDEEKDQQ